MKRGCIIYITGIFIVLLFSGCGNNDEVPVVNPREVKAESQKANAFFDSVYHAELERNPEKATLLGIKTNADRWTEHTEASAKQEMETAKTVLEKLHKRIDMEKLDDQTRISYRYFELRQEQTIDDYKWRFYSYPVNHVDGFQQAIPDLLIRRQQVNSTADAKAYIARLNANIFL